MTSMIERVAKAIVYDVEDLLTDQAAHEMARAAIKAMREPSDKMIAAYYKCPRDSGNMMWQAMIDAALEE